MSTKLKELLQELQCPFIDDNHIMNDDDFLERKTLRMQVLQWLFTLVYPGSNELYTLQPYVFDVHGSTIDVNDTVKALTGIASSMGLCNEDDYLLILGKCTKKKDLAFWDSLTEITRSISSSSGKYDGTVENTQRLLLSYDEDVYFPRKLDLLTPVMKKELQCIPRMQQKKLEQEHVDTEFQIRKLLNKPEAEKTEEDRLEEKNLLDKLMAIVEKRDNIVNSMEDERVKTKKKRDTHFDSSEIMDKLHELGVRQKDILERVNQKENEIPSDYTKCVNSGEYKTRQRSMDINMKDMFQLTTAFDEKFEENFKLPDQLINSQKHVSGQLEAMVSLTNQQTAKLSQVIDEMEDLKCCSEGIALALSSAENDIDLAAP